LHNGVLNTPADIKLAESAAKRNSTSKNNKIKIKRNVKSILVAATKPLNTFEKMLYFFHPTSDEVGGRSLKWKPRVWAKLM